MISGVNMPSKYSMKIYTCEYINKNNKVCGGSACKSNFGYLCNTHYLKQSNKETKNKETLNNDKDIKKDNTNDKKKNNKNAKKSINKNKNENDNNNK